MAKIKSKKLSDADLENVSGGDMNCHEYHSEDACKAASCFWDSKDSYCYWVYPQ